MVKAKRLFVGRGDPAEEPPIRTSQVCTLWFNRFATGIYLTLPYTLSVFMVRSFEGNSASEEKVGRNTGILAAAASVGQCLSAFLWGTISDRIGRKPVLMVGNMSACLSVTALGLAPNYIAAVASRFIGGLFTSASGVSLKSIVAESYGPVGQAKLIGYTTAGYSIGAIAGPTIGGVLASPCDTLLSGSVLCTRGAWLQDRPFLLPCLVSACISALAFLSNLCLMSESNPRFAAAQYTKLSTDTEAGCEPQQMPQTPTMPEQHTQMIERESSGQFSEGTSTEPMLQPSQSPGEHYQYEKLSSADAHGQEAAQPMPFSNHDSSVSQSMAEQSGADLLQQQPSATSDLSHVGRQTSQLPGSGDVQLAVFAPTGQTHQKPWPQTGPLACLPPEHMSTNEVDGHHGAERSQAPASASFSSTGRQSSGSQASLDLGSEKEHLLSGRRRASSQEEGDQRDVEGLEAGPETARADAVTWQDADRPWYKQGIVVLCLLGCGLITLCVNYLDELAPIFASAQPSAGGLAMSTSDFAWPLAFGGLTLMLFSILIYPVVQKRFGLVNCCKAGLLISISTTLIIPTAHAFGNHAWVAQAFMFVGLGMRSISKIMSLSSSTIIINTVAPMRQIGSVNGAGQTLNALARSLGPFIAGILWGEFAGMTNVSGKQYLPFLIGTAALLIPFSLYTGIKLVN